MEMAPEVRDLYKILLGEIKKFGEVIEEKKKTSIHLKSGKAFAGVHPRKNYFILTIVCSSPIKSPRIIKTEQVSKNRFHNELKVGRPADINVELLAWLKDAYHLMSDPPLDNFR